MLLCEEYLIKSTLNRNVQIKLLKIVFIVVLITNKFNYDVLFNFTMNNYKIQNQCVWLVQSHLVTALFNEHWLKCVTQSAAICRV